MEPTSPALVAEICSSRNHNERKTINIEGRTTLGSASSCDLKLSGNEISPLHARIEPALTGRWRIRHLSPDHKTFKNGVEIGEAPLESGDVLQIGPNEIHFRPPQCELPNGELESRNSGWNEKLKQIPSIALADYPVLLLGPSGSGKDFLAKRIHSLSQRKSRPLISVNCAALNESLVESELFGHKRGSFTGAVSDRMGAFETANHGTLFLDEIGDLPLSVQAKILRALENKEIKAIGSDQTVSVDVRVIAATHKDLSAMAEEGSFRKDLLYRLNVIHLKVPSLKDRPEDIQQIIQKYATEMKVRISDPAMLALCAYDWPGNIREIKNFLARANSLFPGLLVTEERVPQLLDLQQQSQLPEGRSELIMGRTFLRNLEREMILERLKMNNWNQRRTAVDLGIPKSTLHDRIRKYGLVKIVDANGG